MEFESEGLAICIWCIGLSFPRRFVEVKVRGLLLLGSWNPRRLCGLVVFLGPPIKLWGFLKLCVLVVFLGPPIKLWRFLKLCEAFVAISWEPPIQLWRFPQALCGFGDHPQGSIVDRVYHLGGKAFVAFGDLCAQHRSNGY